MRLILLIGVAAAVLAGCAGGGGSGTTLKEGPSVPGFEFTQESGVSEGETIDRRFTCDGENVSPALSWTGVPDETKELALAFDDPDAPGGTFTHWLAYGLDPSTSELPGGGSTEGWTGTRRSSARAGTTSATRATADRVLQEVKSTATYSDCSRSMGRSSSRTA